MADDPRRILGHQRQRQIAFCAQPVDQLLLVAVRMGHVPKRCLGQREDRRCIAAAFGPDRDRGHSKCPDRSRLVAR